MTLPLCNSWFGGPKPSLGCEAFPIVHDFAPLLGKLPGFALRLNNHAGIYKMALRLPYSVVPSRLVPASLGPLFWREFEVGAIGPYADA